MKRYILLTSVIVSFTLADGVGGPGPAPAGGKNAAQPNKAALGAEGSKVAGETGGRKAKSKELQKFPVPRASKEEKLNDPKTNVKPNKNQYENTSHQGEDSLAQSGGIKSTPAMSYQKQNISRDPNSPTHLIRRAKAKEAKAGRGFLGSILNKIKGNHDQKKDVKIHLE